MISDIFILQNPWRNETGYTFGLRRRLMLDILLEQIDNPKIIGLLGSRQVGKSSLLFSIIEHLLTTGIPATDIFYFNLDDLKLHELFASPPDFIRFLGSGSQRKYVFIDEIQRLPNPGLFLKEIYDLRRPIKILYSGSSQLEMQSKLKENLVGRSRPFTIPRLSFAEYMEFNEPITKADALEQMLVYGSYPGVALEKAPLEKRLTIKDIYQSYVEKDLVDFMKIKSIQACNKLLILLANQIGGLLSVEALARALRIGRLEVESYLDILENTFVIKRIYPFYKNYKKEITKTPKIYFLDLGLRNFVLNNHNELFARNDIGVLFENFCLLQLLANDPYGLNKINYWRTTNQTEIDFIVAQEQGARAIEVKWGSSKPPRSFVTFQKHYPDIQTEVVSRDFFLT
jgi:predicted AAA+ superfamily ATPase